MTKTNTTSVIRKPWVRPAVQKIAAGAAEVGNRTSSDSTFAAS